MGLIIGIPFCGIFQNLGRGDTEVILTVPDHTGGYEVRLHATLQTVMHRQAIAVREERRMALPAETPLNEERPMNPPVEAPD